MPETATSKSRLTESPPSTTSAALPCNPVNPFGSRANPRLAPDHSGAQTGALFFVGPDSAQLVVSSGLIYRSKLHPSLPRLGRESTPTGNEHDAVAEMVVEEREALHHPRI